MSNLARFFVEADQIDQGKVVIYGDDAHHITRVLRLTHGTTIECVDPSGTVHRVSIEELGSKVVGVIQGTSTESQESPVYFTLFQGLAKGDKMDLVVQKAVELGASEIVPFSSRFSVVKLDPKQAENRKKRWERIALEAAKQCGRTRLATVSDLHSFKELVAEVQKRHSEGNLVLLAYEGEKQVSLGDLTGNPKAVSAIVGPEGGFAPDEVEELTRAGAQVCTLGPRILRTETAGLVMLSVLGYKWGDLG
ncbi:MAG: 16S rRNA (uracil(1498)-N(3))-methyltransferase [Firmicutes bacterium]|nr:16S rRNA (uracil(1498)-N(3))-methyltransferase [Bacillota bacterium]